MKGTSLEEINPIEAQKKQPKDLIIESLVESCHDFDKKINDDMESIPNNTSTKMKIAYVNQLKWVKQPESQRTDNPPSNLSSKTEYWRSDQKPKGSVGWTI